MHLRELSEAVGVSGKEDAVRRVVLKAIDGHAEDIRIDPMGSVTGVKRATGGIARLRVMLAAHMDEVGMIVRGIDGDGLIRFSAVGGIDERILPGLRVRVGDNLINGVILWTPIHLNRDQNVTKMSSLRIDIGASDKGDASSKVKPGDRIAFDARYLEIGERVLRGKAFDDRAGCSLLIDVLQDPDGYPVDVLAAFTVQEEIGLRGATVAANTLTPDVGFALESMTAGDQPDPTANPDDEETVNPTCVMGAGPALTVIDSSTIVNPRLLAFLRQTAEREGIPYQFKTRPGGGTDVGAIQYANGGTPVATISLPCRYIHSPMAYLHRDDYDHALRLIKAALRSITPEVIGR